MNDLSPVGDKHWGTWLYAKYIKYILQILVNKISVTSIDLEFPKSNQKLINWGLWDKKINYIKK